MLLAEFETAQATGRRRSARAAVSIDARIGHDGLKRTLCKVVDLSLHGVRLEIYSALRRGSTIWITLPAIGLRAAKVVWSNDFAAGCQFCAALDPAAFDAIVALDETLDRDHRTGPLAAATGRVVPGN